MKKHEIYYQEFGNGNPIYFVHGKGLNLESMVYFYEQNFSEDSRFRRVYLDIPGMGDSELNSSIKNSDDILQEISRFIELDAKGSQFKLCGHSYGGYLCLGLVKNFGNQVEELFLTCPVVKAHKKERQVAKHKNIFVEEVTPSSNQEYFSDYLENNVVINPQTWSAYQKAILPGILKQTDSFWKNISDDKYAFSFEDQLAELLSNTRGTILLGKHDQVVGYQDQLNFVKTTNLEAIVLDDCGHNLPLDDQTALVKYFSNFIA